jgi:hypothetical protein
MRKTCANRRQEQSMSEPATPYTKTIDYAETLHNYLQGHEMRFPAQLALGFPRILEKIVVVWSKPDDARAYFKDLMLTEREGRAGFPHDVYSEIFALSNVYDMLYPPQHQAVDDFWRWVGSSGKKDIGRAL